MSSDWHFNFSPVHLMSTSSNHRQSNCICYDLSRTSSVSVVLMVRPDTEEHFAGTWLNFAMLKRDGPYVEAGFGN